jgi:hypothetical protein
VDPDWPGNRAGARLAALFRFEVALPFGKRCRRYPAVGSRIISSNWGFGKSPGT